MNQRHYHLVTGRLAADALRRTIAPLAEQLGFAYTIDVLPITVAALMTPAWIVRKLQLPNEATHLLLPGYCDPDITPLAELYPDIVIERGPRDLHRLPEFFGGRPAPTDYGGYSIEIIAEINHCPRLTLAEIITKASDLRAAGADVIDIGCEPGGPWLGVADAVRALVDLGLRVSIDSLDPREIEPAARAGAELVLSVNSTNREAAVDWGIEVVAIPDDPHTLSEFDATIDYLACRQVPLRIDPILEPIGCGFAASLLRYADVRRRYPDAAMMMGIGNLTELTDVDSAGVNALLLALCEEWGITSVLTTQVINWARTSVRECDIARRMVHHALRHGVPPKHLDTRLLVTRDASLTQVSDAELDQLAASIRDNDFRIIASGDQVHLVGRGVHLADRDPFSIIRLLLEQRPTSLDASHAFYLGYEMHKALTANVLGKHYTQDEALDWGYLTQPEQRHYLRSRPRSQDEGAKP